MPRGPMWWDGLSGLRLVIAIYGMLVLLFSGGCALFELLFVRPGPFQQLSVFIGGVVFFIGICIFYVAMKWSWRGDGEPDSAQKWYRGLSPLRWVFVVLGIAIMLFFGWGIFRVIAFEKSIPALIFGGGPFIIGLSIFILAIKAGRS